MKDLPRVTQLVGGRTGAGPGQAEVRFHPPHALSAGAYPQGTQLVMQLYFVLIFYAKPFASDHSWQGRPRSQGL